VTIRRKFIATVLAAVTTFGCVALPTASAAPASHRLVVTGSDSLAGYANTALDSWVSYSRTGSSRALNDYNSMRDSIAAEAARRLGADPATLQAAWRRADYTHQVALLAGFTQLGTKYRRNTSIPGVGFDCSGLTSWSWSQAGVSLFHQSAVQIQRARRVTRDTAQAGDLVYYPGHVMLYLGVGNLIIHAPYTGRNIELSSITKSRVNSVLFGNPLG